MEMTELDLLTDNMKMLFMDVLGLLGSGNIPKEIIRFVFGPDEDIVLISEFAKAVTFELIKYSYDKKASKYPLRHFLGYDSTDNTERMSYSRAIEYSQKYRTMEYKRRVSEDSTPEDIEKMKPLLKPPMSSIEDKKKGYQLTEMNFYEDTNIRDLQLIKSIVERRIISAKKVPNDTFDNYFSAYDSLVKNLMNRYLQSDEDCVFSSIAFFTLEWKFAIEFFYEIATQMDEYDCELPNIHFLTLTSGEITFPSAFGCEISVQSRMIIPRMILLDAYFFDEEYVSAIQKKIYMDRYAEALAILTIIKEHIGVGNNQKYRDWFADNSDVHDWASFLRFYNVFDIFNEKEWSNKKRQYMRKLYDTMIMKKE